MRVVGLHADVLVCTSALLADDVHDRPRPLGEDDGAEAFVIDSPVLPEELEALPALLEQVGWPCSRAAGDARRLGPPARAARVPGRRARRRRDDGRAPDRRAGRRRARAARLRRRALRRAPARRSRSASSRRCRCPASSRSARASSSCTRPRATSPTAWRSGSPWAKVLDLRATSCRRWRSRCCPRAARARAYRATLERLRPLVEQADHVVPGHGAVLDGVRARGDPARGPRLPRDARAAAGAAQRRAAPDPRREPRAHRGDRGRTGGRPVIQHVTLEVREADAPAEVAFWALLGFAEVQPPAGMERRSRWVEGGGTAGPPRVRGRDPVVPTRGHVGVVAADFDATVAALRDGRSPRRPARRALGRGAGLRAHAGRPHRRGDGGAAAAGPRGVDR